MHQPTFVNLIRDPISWFQSHYTFMRFGMNKGRSEDSPKLGSVSYSVRRPFDMFIQLVQLLIQSLLIIIILGY